MVMSDGETLTYKYINYGEYDADNGNYPAPTTLNSVDSSLGFRIYGVPNPTNSSNLGAFNPISATSGGGSLYAIK